MDVKNIEFSVTGVVASQGEIDHERKRVERLRKIIGWPCWVIYFFAIWLGWRVAHFVYGAVESRHLADHAPAITDLVSQGLYGFAAGCFTCFIIIIPFAMLLEGIDSYLKKLSPLGADRVDVAAKLFGEHHEFEEYRCRVVSLRALCNGDLECLEQYKKELEQNQAAAQEELDRQEDLEALAALNRPSK